MTYSIVPCSLKRLFLALNLVYVMSRDAKVHWKAIIVEPGLWVSTYLDVGARIVSTQQWPVAISCNASYDKITEYRGENYLINIE